MTEVVTTAMRWLQDPHATTTRPRTTPPYTSIPSAGLPNTPCPESPSRDLSWMKGKLGQAGKCGTYILSYMHTFLCIYMGTYVNMYAPTFICTQTHTFVFIYCGNPARGVNGLLKPHTILLGS